MAYVAVLAQTWAAVEPRQRRVDHGSGTARHGTARTIDQLVNDFLLTNDPFPVGTTLFTARWQPGRGLARVVSRDDMDEWTVAWRPRFDHERLLVREIDERHGEWEAAYDEIADALTLRDPDGQAVETFLVHIDGDTERWRRT